MTEAMSEMDNAFAMLKGAEEEAERQSALHPFLCFDIDILRRVGTVDDLFLKVMVEDSRRAKKVQWAINVRDEESRRFMSPESIGTDIVIRVSREVVSSLSPDRDGGS